jgi:flagellar hook-associated protein 3 FlgL
MTIDRIGSYANTQLMLAHVMKAENGLDISNRQVATGKVADNYAGYRDKTAIMEAARSASARADANAAAAMQAAARLDVQDSQLTQMSELANDIRQALTKAAADRDSTSLMSQLESYFDQIVGLLNAKDANGYIYAGDNNQPAPVTVSSLVDLAALPSVADAFVNGAIKTEVKIGDSQTVQVGLLASDIATELFTLLRQAAQFDVGVDGPFSGGNPTTPAQQTYIESLILPAIDAQHGVNAQAAANGIHYQTVQKATEQLQAASVVYKGFVSNIEDVDMAKALAQLNQNQVALQAAFQVTSTLNRLSLLDYLPII